MLALRVWSHRPVETPSVGISGCNRVKSGGPTSKFDHNPQQFHSWNQTESLVWSGHESWVNLHKSCNMENYIWSTYASRDLKHGSIISIVSHCAVAFSTRLWSATMTSNYKCKVELGPLHTRAKSCDHEIVRAPKKVSKGRPNTPPKSCSVVTDT
jgi:hypothetical protein